MTAPPLLLHVGYHKTATTWMQRQLFVPAHGFRQVAFHREAFDHVVAPHGFDFDPAPLAALLAERAAALAPGEVPVLSSEILSGHPFQGGHGSDVYAERLARIAPQARILISIRSQLRILPSVYMQYLLRGGTQPWDRFFAGTDELGYFAFTPRHFEYDRLVACYQRLFGAGRVHVLTQESLQRDMAGAAAAVAAFAGAAFAGLTPEARRVEAASYPEYAAPVLRRINHVQASTLDPWPVVALGRTPGGLFRLAGGLLRRPPFAPLLQHRRPVSEHVRQRFAGYYRDSNRRLAALVPGLDLTGYDGIGD
jgi:hypothetical protein